MQMVLLLQGRIRPVGRPWSCPGPVGWQLHPQHGRSAQTPRMPLHLHEGQLLLTFNLFQDTGRTLMLHDYRQPGHGELKSNQAGEGQGSGGLGMLQAWCGRRGARVGRFRKVEGQESSTGAKME